MSHLLDPVTLSKLDSMQVRARRVVEGVLTGLHRSPHHGQSVEFAEHKEYSPGDELRHLDWKAYARFDKYYVKRFEMETNLRAFLLVDGSASMNYRSNGVSKLQYATYLAGALAYLFARQQDAVGLLVAGDPDESAAAPGHAPRAAGVRAFVPPRASSGHLAAVLDGLERLGAAGGRGPTDLAAAVRFIMEKARRRALVFIVSDLFDPDPAAVARLKMLKHRRHEVYVFHVLDREELEFPFEDPTEFHSMEDARMLEAHPRQIRESYLEELQAFIEGTRRTLREADVGYELVRTDTPLDRALLDWLGKQQK
jgi:uncharacterized protein (DUF58 family)